MDLLARFQNNIKKQDLFHQKDRLLLAVSGGVDSVALCELCTRAGYDFVIAHCNFKLRDQESERDMEFVRALAQKYAVGFFVKNFETAAYAAEKKISIQEAARELRYGWFSELINEQSTIDNKQKNNCQLPIANWLLTAHHANDNAETVLMNFFRGTGLHGLTGIPAGLSFVRRPLLPFSKKELLDFAKENKLDFVEDSSNQSSKYTRNFFRNEIIPAIQKVYPEVNDNLQDNINRFKEIERLYKFAVGEMKKKLCKPKGKEVYIPVRQLMAFNNRALIYEIISGYGFHEKQVEEVLKLAASDSGKYIQSPAGHYRIIKHRHWFILSPVQSAEAEHIIIEEGIGYLEFGIGSLGIATAPNSQSPITNSSTQAFLDRKEISFPLLLRKWKTGDYFYPLGMKKKKKLARFFIDQKLSKSQKEEIWVIESAQRVAWIIGYRIDDRFKVTEKTKTILQVEFTRGIGN